MDDPTGRLADDAAMSLAKAFMKAKMYFEAGDTLEDLRRNYPGSEFQFDAHLLELEAQLASYQGPSYDDGPLRKADEIMKSIVRAFPQKSKGELAYLEKQSARIQNMLGQRDLTMGEYFERRGENLAARFHYQKIHEKFKGTEIANQIEQRIAATQSKPDRPAPPAEWLVNVFPDPEKAKPVIVAGDNESILGIKRR
jgi:outer membrane protein assembly factor BamD (BamD/ComL family)